MQGEAEPRKEQDIYQPFVFMLGTDRNPCGRDVFSQKGRIFIIVDGTGSGADPSENETPESVKQIIDNAKQLSKLLLDTDDVERLDPNSAFLKIIIDHHHVKWIGRGGSVVGVVSTATASGFKNPEYGDMDASLKKPITACEHCFSIDRTVSLTQEGRIAPFESDYFEYSPQSQINFVIMGSDGGLEFLIHTKTFQQHLTYPQNYQAVYDALALSNSQDEQALERQSSIVLSPLTNWLEEIVRTGDYVRFNQVMKELSTELATNPPEVDDDATLAIIPIT